MFDLASVKQMNVVIRPTRYCENGCAHCYISEENRSDSQLMDETVFEQTCNFINNYCQAYNLNYLRLVWHGGEPLSVPKSWYEMTHAHLAKLKIEYSEDLQTSLSVYNDSWKSFIQYRLHSRLIISLDLSTRLYAGTLTQYLEDWKTKYHALLRESIDILIVVTISREDVCNAQKVFEILTSLEIPATAIINFRKACTTSTIVGYVSNHDYSVFMIEFTNLVLKHLKDNVMLPNFEAITRPIRGIIRYLEHPVEKLAISEMFCCLKQPRMIIDSKGQISNCLMHEHSEFGSIYDDPTKLFKLPKHIELQRQYSRVSYKLSSLCRVCNHSEWCYLRCFMPSVPDGVAELDCPGSKMYNDQMHVLMLDTTTRQVFEKYLESCGISAISTAFELSAIPPMHRDLHT